jgi:arginine decarboxylase
MPIHMLNTPPTHHAVLGDITCDSDGKIDQFIDRRDVKRTLPLHTVNGDPYYLGVFLVGAYQEILGDLHNLFGDTHAVHVSLDERGSVVLDAVIKGDTVKEVLDYVEFDAETLVRKLRHDVEHAVREGKIATVRQVARVLRRRTTGLHLLRIRKNGRNSESFRCAVLIKSPGEHLRDHLGIPHFDLPAFQHESVSVAQQPRSG